MNNHAVLYLPLDGPLISA